MIVSAQAGPLVQPYYLAGQVQGLVTGLAGGGAYEKMMGRMGLVAQRWNGYSGGLLAAVVAILIGGIFNAAYGLAIFVGSTLFGFLYDRSLSFVIFAIIILELLAFIPFFMMKKEICAQ